MMHSQADNVQAVFIHESRNKEPICKDRNNALKVQAQSTIYGPLASNSVKRIIQ